MIMTLTGENSFEKKLYLKSLIDQQRLQYGPYSVNEIDLDEINDSALLPEILPSNNLFSANLLYVFSATTINVEIRDYFSSLLQNEDLSIDIILNLSKIDNKTILAKLLKSKSKYCEFNKLDRVNLKKWLVNYVKQLGGEIKDSTAEYLINNFSSDQFMLSTEIQKLILYNQTIDIENVKLLSDLSLKGDVFNLIEAIFTKQTTKSIAIYRHLRRQNQPSLAIIATIGWSLTNIVLVKLASAKTIDQLKLESGINPNSLSFSKKIANTISLNSLKKVVSQLSEIDFQSKKSAINLDNAMETYFLELSVTLS